MSTIQSNLHYVPQMFRLSAHFSGRELSCIQDGLHNNRVVVISGRAGTSKTQLELRCANSLLQDHQVVWWLSSENERDLQQDFLLIGQRAKILSSSVKADDTKQWYYYYY